MGRKIKKCAKKCQKHGFLLKPVHYFANFSRELSACFCPNAVDDPSITPRFNKDKRHYTSSFMLPADDVLIVLPQKKLQDNDQYHKMEHEKYIIENGTQKSKIFIPKPRSKNLYCNVCKTDYDDYLQHIQGESHRLKIRQNRFNLFIEEMCEDMKKEEEERRQQSRFNNNSQTFLSFPLSQTPLPPECSQFQFYFQGFDLNQIANPKHLNSNFQLLPDHNELQLGALHYENEGMCAVPPISPIKKYSQVTDCLRVGSTKLQRPIILCGGSLIIE